MCGSDEEGVKRGDRLAEGGEGVSVRVVEWERLRSAVTVQVRTAEAVQDGGGGEAVPVGCGVEVMEGTPLWLPVGVRDPGEAVGERTLSVRVDGVREGVREPVGVGGVRVGFGVTVGVAAAPAVMVQVPVGEW